MTLIYLPIAVDLDESMKQTMIMYCLVSSGIARPDESTLLTKEFILSETKEGRNTF